MDHQDSGKGVRQPSTLFRTISPAFLGTPRCAHTPYGMLLTLYVYQCLPILGFELVLVTLLCLSRCPIHAFSYS